MIDYMSNTWDRAWQFCLNLRNLKGMPYMDDGARRALGELLYDKMIEIKLREAKKFIAEQEAP